MGLIYTHIFPHIYMDKFIYEDYVYIKQGGCVYPYVFYNMYMCMCARTHSERTMVLFIAVYPCI